MFKWSGQFNVKYTLYMSKTHIASLYESTAINKVNEARNIPEFRAGCTVAVTIRIIDGATERTSVFQGVCVAISRKGINSFFVLRKMSADIGVERVIPFYSPLVTKIEVTREGKVRRAKLFYLRKLRGKKARIKERVSYTKK